MNSTIVKVFDQLISITAVRFANGFNIVPKRIELDGTSYDCESGQFTEGEKIFVFHADNKIFKLAPGKNMLDWRLKAIIAE